MLQTEARAVLQKADLARDMLTAWEDRFVTSCLESNFPFSSKQLNVIERIADKLRIDKTVTLINKPKPKATPVGNTVGCIKNLLKECTDSELMELLDFIEVELDKSSDSVVAPSAASRTRSTDVVSDARSLKASLDSTLRKHHPNFLCMDEDIPF